MNRSSRRELFDSWVGGAELAYGTSLSPDRFEIAEGKLGSFTASVSAYAPSGEEAHYQLHMNPRLLGVNKAICIVNKMQMIYLDPYTERSQGILADASDWYSWILRQDAAGQLVRNAPETPWSGDSIEAMLRRAEQNIVGYAECWTHSDNFDDLSQLQYWLDLMLENSPAKAKVVALNPASRDRQGLMTELYDLHMVFDSDTASLIPDLEGCSADKPVGTASLNALDINWFPDADELEPPRWESSIDVLMNGAAIERANGHGAALTERSGAVINSDQRSVKLKKSQRWCAIAFVGAPHLLVFPRASTTLQLSLDQDGALAAIRAFPDQKIAKLRRADWKFRQKWGRWIDDSVTLSQAELDAGVVAVEQLLLSEREID